MTDVHIDKRQNLASSPKDDQVRPFAHVFDGVRPWAGQVLEGFIVDFLGTLTDIEFRTIFAFDPAMAGGKYVETRLPVIADGEGWFEAVNWVEAAREARDRYVMVTLGACYGAQAVGAYRALQLLNPMPYKLVAVEAEPGNYAWMQRHMRDNGIDPEDQWLVQTAISDKNAPVLFPVGWPGMGIGNCFSTNEDAARKEYAQQLIAAGEAEQAVRNLLINNTTEVVKNLVPGEHYEAEIKMASAVTLRDILSPFDVVDFLESDIQQSEILVFPPFMKLLKRKVRRVLIGTHGGDVHSALATMFRNDGWEIIFDYAPNGSYTSALGSFTTNDGVLTARNPDLCGAPRHG